MKPGKGLTIGVLMGGKPKKDEPDGDEIDSEESDDSEDSDELPPGLLEAISEFRSAEDDETAARAFQTAMTCCQDY